jgi:hypothetical protein
MKLQKSVAKILIQGKFDLILIVISIFTHGYCAFDKQIFTYNIEELTLPFRSLLRSDNHP